MIFERPYYTWLEAKEILAAKYPDRNPVECLLIAFAIGPLSATVLRGNGAEIRVPGGCWKICEDAWRRFGEYPFWSTYCTGYGPGKIASFGTRNGVPADWLIHYLKGTAEFDYHPPGVNRYPERINGEMRIDRAAFNALLGAETNTSQGQPAVTPSTENRKSAPPKRRRSPGHQIALNHVAVTLANEGTGITIGNVKRWLEENTSDDAPCRIDKQECVEFFANHGDLVVCTADKQSPLSIKSLERGYLDEARKFFAASRTSRT